MPNAQFCLDRIVVHMGHNIYPNILSFLRAIKTAAIAKVLQKSADTPIQSKKPGI
ncbi:MAG: hypothetical protein F6J93_21375 [Oscillatoria sp. SIO1A7]|nr:hypothetical protein [Oscillatoria sp. SIO1A7]